MSEKEEKIVIEPTSSKKTKKPIIICVVAVLILIILCAILISNSKKNSGTEQQSELILDENGNIDFSKVQVITIKFKLQNSLGKDIEKIYIRDNTNENFSRELSKEIKDGEIVDLEYGNYSPVFTWDFKIVFKDGTETTLNSLIAANMLYDGATLELVKLGESNVGVENHEMITFDGLGEETSTEETTEEETEEETDEAEPTEDVENVVEETNTVEE